MSLSLPYSKLKSLILKNPPQCTITNANQRSQSAESSLALSFLTFYPYGK